VKINMKKLKAILISMICLIFVITIAGCDKKDNNQSGDGGQVIEDVDYVAQTKLDQEVTESSSFFGADGIAYATVVRCVDGDTADFLTGGVEFRARFLGVDTPESTGDVEVWGKTASLFTASKLNNANKVVIQTNGGAAQKDTTGTRYLTYVWYQPTAGADFRLINLELVQEGLSYGKSSTASRYGDVLNLAQVQAMRNKLRIFGNDIDENYYYGDAIKTTIKGIYENFAEYSEKHAKVKFDCVVTRTNGLDVYVLFVTPLPPGKPAFLNMALSNGLNSRKSIFIGYMNNPETLTIENDESVCRAAGQTQWGKEWVG
jgi:endonuclease YncB( thermonuclease family)